MAESLHFSDKKSQLTPDAQALDAADTVAKHDLGRAGRWGLWALGLGFGGFLLWAALAPLDEGVPGPGVVALDTKRKAVQHLSGGIVQQVLVREGDEVKEGQL
ncbi:MAG: secretion protein HlyD, partial [Acidovorax sp.]